MLLFVAIGFFSAAAHTHETIFNNFLKDTFDLSAGARGWLELPRELPGFLVVLMTGVLCMLPVTRLGVVGASVFIVGMIGMALVGTSFWPMLVMMMIGSAGMHLLQPVGQSLAIGLSAGGNRGRNMGLTGMFGNVGVIVGAGLVYLTFDKDNPQYKMGFLIAGGIAVVAVGAYALMNVPHLHEARARLVFKRKFFLYYLLELLFGARKQIFITFGLWVLVAVYKQPAKEVARLFIIAAFIGLAFKPLIGVAIDRFGERTVLVFDGIVLSIVCLGYGFAGTLMGSLEAGRPIACACLILDNLLFSLGTGRAVYASRLADSPQELTSTLAMGVSINHIVSMTLPILVGGAWMMFGYQSVFVAAAVLALTISAVASFVPGRDAKFA